jgi:hypothetical protein
MTYRGTVRRGVVVLEPGAALPEGTDVTVTATGLSTVDQPPPASAQTLGARLMKYAGAVKGLPSDLARNHDHYIHGTPRE